jgi:hypothetical protein
MTLININGKETREFHPSLPPPGTDTFYGQLELILAMAGSEFQEEKKY